MSSREPNHGRPWSLILEDDLLRAIMCFCMLGSIGTLDPVGIPLVFRDVSLQWRSLADSTPALWLGLCIMPTQFLYQNIGVIYDWLERATNTGSAELTIIIHAPKTLTDDTLMRQILATIKHASSQLSCLVLNIQSQYLPFVLSDPNTPLSSLRALTLYMLNQPTCSISHSSAPHLQYLTLIQLRPFTLRASGFHLPWDQIKYLYMRTEEGTIGFISPIFVRCTQLHSLIVVAANDTMIPRTLFEREHRCRSGLQQLTVYTTQSGVVASFLDDLLLPDICALNIIFVNAQSDAEMWPKEAILRLRDRSVAPLREVLISGKEMTEEDLIDFVDRLPTLEKLTATNGTINFATPMVIARLPQGIDMIQQRRLVYAAEVIQAVTDGRRIQSLFQHV